jgi:arylsulfatase
MNSCSNQHRLIILSTVAITLLATGTPLLAKSGLAKAVRTSETLEPAVPHPQQAEIAAEKLGALLKNTGKRPNILWLVVDDMGFGDPGAFGGGALLGAAPPNMDRLASEGLKLTSTYSQPTCTPSRSAMMTGRLPARTGLTRPILAGDVITSNPWKDETSIAEMLSAAGYFTILVGKWHTGELPGMRPFEVGFDEFQGYYASQKELTQQVDERRYPDLVLNPERATAFAETSGKVDMYHGRKGEEEQIVEKTTSI